MEHRDSKYGRLALLMALMAVLALAMPTLAGAIGGGITVNELEDYPTFPPEDNEMVDEPYEGGIGSGATVGGGIGSGATVGGGIGSGATVGGGIGSGATVGGAPSISTVPTSLAGGPIADSSGAWYISLGQVNGVTDYAVHRYDKVSGELTVLPNMHNASELAYVEGNLFAITPGTNGAVLICYDGANAWMAAEGNITRLAVYGGRLFYLLDGQLYSMLPDGTNARRHMNTSMEEYTIIDDIVYFTNMEDTARYSLNAPYTSGKLTINAGRLYYYNLRTGVSAKLLDQGVSGLRAYNGQLYLQNFADAYAAYSNGQEYIAGSISKFDVESFRISRVDASGGADYYPTASGLAVLVDGAVRLYSQTGAYSDIYTFPGNAQLIAMNSDYVGIYEQYTQCLTRIALDGYSGNAILINYASGIAQPHPTAGVTDTFLFPDSSRRKLTNAEVFAVPADKYTEARYEILARNGYVFDDNAYQQYFQLKSWYSANHAFQYADLSALEQYNYELIRSIQNAATATPAPEKSDGSFLFPDSSLRKLARDEVLSIAQSKMLEARYEMLARNGYVFNDKKYQAYFETKSWYYPDTAYQFGDMNEIESYNYALIRAIDEQITATPAPTASVAYRFVFPNSSLKRLTRNEVLAVDHSRLLEGRYEILARNGYVFSSSAYQDYFESRPWYSADPNFKFDDMTQTEAYNYQLIKQMQAELSATPAPTQAPDMSDFIFPYSSTRKLTERQINAIDTELLLEARYEILARNGYIFSSDRYQKYFESKSWYDSDPDFAFADMNDIEAYNYALIKEIDKTQAEPTPAPTEMPDVDYIFPESAVRRLTKRQVESIDSDLLMEARYEILARNGNVFNSNKWQKYFEGKVWYSPDARFEFKDMNDVEAYNYALIRAVDEGTAPDEPNEEQDFIFPESSRRRLLASQIKALDSDLLLEARYEILARNGNVFNSNKWQKYFETKRWYTPNPKFEFEDMSAIESYNYELIRGIANK